MKITHMHTIQIAETDLTDADVQISFLKLLHFCFHPVYLGIDMSGLPDIKHRHQIVIRMSYVFFVRKKLLQNGF